VSQARRAPRPLAAHDLRWPPPPEGFPRRYGKPRNSAPSVGRPLPPTLPTEIVDTPHGVRLERLLTGIGDPVTIFAHGLGHGIAETRPSAAGYSAKGSSSNSAAMATVTRRPARGITAIWPATCGRWRT